MQGLFKQINFMSPWGIPWLGVRVYDRSVNREVVLDSAVEHHCPGKTGILGTPLIPVSTFRVKNRRTPNCHRAAKTSMW